MRGIRVVVATQAVDAVPAASETKPTVTIRRAETRDVAQMTHILSEAADGAVSTQSLATYSREATSVEDTPGAAPEQLALVAECPFPSPSDPPRVVGVVGLLLDDSLKPMEMKLTKEVAYVTNLAVDASARRAGVGATLLAAAESCAQDYACVAVACRVDEGNDPALAMYDKKGYGPLVGRRLGQFRRLMGGYVRGRGGGARRGPAAVDVRTAHRSRRARVDGDGPGAKVLGAGVVRRRSTGVVLHGQRFAAGG